MKENKDKDKEKIVSPHEENKTTTITITTNKQTFASNAVRVRSRRLLNLFDEKEPDRRT
jgi:hypothetical protein